MNKAAIVCGVLGFLLLLVGGIAWWWLYGRSAPSITAADYLPANTLLLAEIPDGTRTWLRWQQTTAKKWAEHPEMQSIWALAASTFSSADLPKDQRAQLEKAVSHLLQAASGLSFIAIPNIPLSTSETNSTTTSYPFTALVGFHGGKDLPTHIDAFFAEVEKLSKDNMPEFQRGNADLSGIPYQWIELKKTPGLRLCHARHNQWELFSIGEAPLRAFLEQLIQGDKTKSLTSLPAYKDTLSRLNPQRDGHIYLNLPAAITLYTNYSSSLLPEIRPMMEESMKPMQNLGPLAWDVHLSGNQIEERSVVGLPPGARTHFGKALDPLQLQALRFTRSETTLACFIASVDWEKNYDQQVATFKAAPRPETQGGQPSADLDPSALLEGKAKAMGFDLRENFLRALGSEFSIILDWPENDTLPELLIISTLADAEKFEPFWKAAESALRMFAVALGHAEDFEADGFKGLTFHLTSVPMISPTFAVGNGMLISTLSGPGAKRLLSPSGTPWTRETLLDYGPLPASASQVARIETATLTARTYAALRPLLAARMSTASDDKIKALANKLPAQIDCASLLGRWSCHSYVEGDWLHTRFRSPLGSMALPLAASLGAAVTAIALNESEFTSEKNTENNPPAEEKTTPDAASESATTEQDAPAIPSEQPSTAPKPEPAAESSTPPAENNNLPEIFDTPPAP